MTDYKALVDELRKAEEYATKDGIVSVGLVYRLSQAADAIEELSDVRPVVRGRWELTPDEWLQHCSMCGQRKPIVAGDFNWHYCPNCGALMDKDGDEDG